MSNLPFTSSANLPGEFPQAVTPPQFQLGDRVHWNPSPAQDFGTVTGLEYAPAEHLQAWNWRYIVWLDSNSPSHAWTRTDTAWEEDLELVVGRDEVGVVFDGEVRPE